MDVKQHGNCAYNPEYCERVLECGRLGKSRAWIASELKVHRDTLYAWERMYPQFSDAMARAKDLEQRWWEDKGQDSLTTVGFQSSAWSRSMGARFPDDWRDNSRQEHVGPGGGPVKTETTVTYRIVDPKDDDAA